MFLVKNIVVFLIGVVQTVLGGLWFTAFALDSFGLDLGSTIHFSVHILFGLLFTIGTVNIFLALINLFHFGFKTKRKVSSAFPIAMLSIIYQAYCS